MADIVEQYSGHGIRRNTEQVTTALDEMRYVLLKDDGSTEELFRGSKFSEEEFKEKMKKEDQTSWLEKYASDVASK